MSASSPSTTSDAPLTSSGRRGYRSGGWCEQTPARSPGDARPAGHGRWSRRHSRPQVRTDASVCGPDTPSTTSRAPSSLSRICNAAISGLRFHLDRHCSTDSELPRATTVGASDHGGSERVACGLRHRANTVLPGPGTNRPRSARSSPSVAECRRSGRGRTARRRRGSPTPTTRLDDARRYETSRRAGREPTPRPVRSAARTCSIHRPSWRVPRPARTRVTSAQRQRATRWQGPRSRASLAEHHEHHNVEWSGETVGGRCSAPEVSDCSGSS